MSTARPRTTTHRHAGFLPIRSHRAPALRAQPTTSTIVVLHAHPDDEAIFTGATIRALADAGHRVVLVTATTGNAGEPRIDLRGRSLREHRIAELETAAATLGVHRLVVLGYGDSGAHAGPWQPGTLGATPATTAADRLTALIDAENADALIHYDAHGIYGHIDHVQVHRIGAAVVARTGITGYEATVDRHRLRTGPRHVLHGAAGDADVGVPAERISLTLHATRRELIAKHAAMAAHVSQIGPEWLDARHFADAYGREWFTRTGRPGALDTLHTPTRELVHA